jgi:hypothetical protein
LKNTSWLLSLSLSLSLTHSPLSLSLPPRNFSLFYPSAYTSSIFFLIYLETGRPKELERKRKRERERAGAGEREREKSVCVIDANGMYKKASEINWKLFGWVLKRGIFNEMRALLGRVFFQSV